MYCVILIFSSVYESLTLVIVILIASFATAWGFWFLVMPTWLKGQAKIIILWIFIK